MALLGNVKHLLMNETKFSDSQELCFESSISVSPIFIYIITIHNIMKNL